MLFPIGRRSDLGDLFFSPRSRTVGLSGAWDLDPLGEFFPGDNLAVDLYEQDDRLVVKVSLPGVPEEDIEITEQDGILTIKANSEVNVERDNEGWHIREQRLGYWQRSLRLPGEVDARRAEGFLENGVLTIHLPKRDASKQLIHKIKIKTPKWKLPVPGNKLRKIHSSRN